ncbi:MAG: 1-deoxy-D-xylulose-5-phosphate reductoisomerase [Cyanobacteriota bacterium]
MAKNISILGSTGSIGQQTLEVIKTLPNHFKVISLAAGKNIQLLSWQIEEFKPEYVSVYSEKEADELKNMLNGYLPEILIGSEGLKYIAGQDNSELIIIAVVGITGLVPTIEAIKAKKTIALANKETLVAGGNLVIPEAKKNNVKILPIDSEHSAIFQCLSNSNKSLNKIIITASGGPFRTWDKDSINTASIEQALTHPNWNMGPKVTIDSATLMNKGLEIIEARWLFDIDYCNIDVLIHPQSIVHSMIEFIDGSILAQLSTPTMHLPIQYALTYPDRLECSLVEPLNLSKIKKLEFYPPDLEKFPCLNLAYKVGNMQGTYPAVLNAANEVAVNAYINGKINFYDIYNCVNSCINNHQSILNPTLEDILNADNWARIYVNKEITIKG